MKKGNWFLSNGVVKNYKAHCTKEYLEAKYGRPYEKVNRPPSIKTMETWSSDCGCEATDGCWTEPDGYCDHGKPSWMLALGYI